MAEQNQKFVIQKIYIKNLKFDSPQGHISLANKRWEPTLELQLTTQSKVIEKDTYEVLLKVSTKTIQDQQTLYTATIEQIGIFFIAGLPKEDLQRTLNTTCPTILFPYLRELLSNTVQRAGFPALYLTPVNFEALYRNEQQKTTQKKNPIPEHLH